MTRCLQKTLGKVSESPWKASDKNIVRLGTKKCLFFLQVCWGTPTQAPFLTCFNCSSFESLMFLAPNMNDERRCLFVLSLGLFKTNLKKCSVHSY